MSPIPINQTVSVGTTLAVIGSPLVLNGDCRDISIAPLYVGQDSTLELAAVIEWDPNNGCFILNVQGSASAPTACQVIIWSGYGGGTGPAGVYTRACDPDGGCSANAGVLTLTVS